MSQWFSPKVPQPIAPPNPADASNRANMALVNQLATQGYNADVIPGSSSGGTVATGAPRMSTLTGLG
ncbi:MAG TPA: hypothetical protein VGF33_09990 [Caulobacteraceae bacterium]|jgi:hypothetical protein